MKKIMNMLLATGAILMGGIVFLGTDTIKADTAEEERIADGIYIGTVDVGGMTASEAQAAVDAYVDGLMETTFTLEGSSGSISITAADMGVSVDTKKDIEHALTIAHSGSLINRYKDTCDLETSDLVMDLNLNIDKQATAKYIYDHSDVLSVEAKDNALKLEDGVFQIVDGQIGYEVNVVDSVYVIDDFLCNIWDGENNTINLVIDEVAPRGSREELSQVKDLLGSYTTDFGSSSTGRGINVRNGCNKMNGLTIYPRDEVSVYATISPFTPENGYELAGAYSNGMVIESFGGGICQVATTLYNALIRAELDVTMRYNHSMLVSYVKPSEDAAIAGTYKDLRFVNNMDTPIYIEGYCTYSKITFNIYGVETRPDNRTIAFESEVLSQGEPSYQFNLDGTQPIGYWNVVQGAHLETNSRLWKVVRVDGVEESRELFNTSYYVPGKKIIQIGTAGASEEQMAILNSLIPTNDEATIKAAVYGFRGESVPGTTEQPATEQPPQTPPENTTTEQPPQTENVPTQDTNNNGESQNTPSQEQTPHDATDTAQ